MSNGEWKKGRKPRDVGIEHKANEMSSHNVGPIRVRISTFGINYPRNTRSAQFLSPNLRLQVSNPYTTNLPNLE